MIIQFDTDTQEATLIEGDEYEDVYIESMQISQNMDMYTYKTILSIDFNFL